MNLYKMKKIIKYKEDSLIRLKSAEAAATTEDAAYQRKHPSCETHQIHIHHLFN